MNLHQKNKIFTKMYLLDKYRKINNYALVLESLKIAVKESDNSSVIYKRTVKIYKNLLKKLTIKELKKISLTSYIDPYHNGVKIGASKKEIIENEVSNRSEFIFKLSHSKNFREKLLNG